MSSVERSDQGTQRGFGLDGRVAFITGGGTGIGRQIALTLAGAGASVILAGRDASHLADAVDAIRALGCAADALPLDIADSADVEAAAQQAIRMHGQVDILVNNAGQFGNSPAEDMSDEDWRRVIDVNISGTYWCCRSFGRHMLARGSGAIVNVASISGLVVNTPQPQIAYNVSKAGIVMLTKSLAAEWAARGVRVNAVSPGYIATTGTVGGAETPGWGERWRSLTPMGRMGSLEEIARAVQYLASDDAGYTTGSNLVVDGGYTLW